jgi:membrane-bound lytic murein transglycosylase A
VRGRSASWLFLIAVIIFLSAVGAWLYLRNKQPTVVATERLRLTPVSFADLPGWRSGDPRAALAAFRRSCDELAKKNPLSTMGGAGYAGTIGDWMGVCKSAPQTPDASAARRFFESAFAPVAVNKDTDEGLFTGYYEPELRASHTKHGDYRTPIYGVPDDLITVDLGLFKTTLQGQSVTGILQGHVLVPYPDRAEINAKGLPHAKVLAWGDDPVAVFFLHIQGSGRALLDDGTSVRIAYAGQNGRPYTPVGRTLIREGAMSRADMSMQGIRAWMQGNPQEARRVMETDASFVFFDEKPLGDPTLGANGSQGVPLTPGASLAVDRSIHPLGVPLWLALDEHSTALPRNRLMVAQDTGGAIKGAVRGDVYFGFGEKPEWNAGHMKAAGAMFVLLPKALAAHIPAEFAP